MQWMNARTRLMAAGGLLLAGAGYAATVAQSSPEVEGPSPAHLREIAQRATQQPAPAVALTVPLLPAPAAPAPVKPRATRRMAAALAPRIRIPSDVPILPPGDGSTVVGIRRRVQPAPVTRQAAAPAAPESPVKNIALMGVTFQNQKEVAWLVNLDNQEREMVSVGENGFGFSVRDIGEESVVLARGSNEFTVRLGDKPIPVNEGPAVASAAAPESSGGGEGRRGRRQWGGGAPSAFAAGGTGGFGGRGNRGNWGGQGNRAGRSFASSSGGSPTTFGGSNRGGATGGGAGFSGGRNTAAATRSGGGFMGNRPGFAGGGGFQNRNGAANSQFAAGASGPTSNPQTARRRGGQLIGGATPIEQPQAITNPQTQRRLGGAATGAAFGQGGPNVGGQNRGTGQNRGAQNNVGNRGNFGG